MIARLVGVVVPAGMPVGVAQVEAAAFVAQAGGAICHGEEGGAEGLPDRDGQDHAGHDCFLCPVCLGGGFARVGAADRLVVPAAFAVVRFVVPAVGADPALSRFATGRPRGPPASV
jgi:hypothetical protein